MGGLRLAGWLALWIGFSMLFKPLEVLLDIIPFLGPYLGTGLSYLIYFFTFLLTLAQHPHQYRRCESDSSIKHWLHTAGCRCLPPEQQPKSLPMLTFGLQCVIGTIVRGSCCLCKILSSSSCGYSCARFGRDATRACISLQLHGVVQKLRRVAHVTCAQGAARIKK